GPVGPMGRPSYVVLRGGLSRLSHGLGSKATQWFPPTNYVVRCGRGLQKQHSCCVALNVEEWRRQCISTGHRMSPSRAAIAGVRSVMNCGPPRALLRFVPYVTVSRSLT